MMKAERQELILKRVADSGRVVVTDLAKEMGVTETTLRKDLQELDDRGAVQRVHGGAIKPDTELSRFENRVDLGADVKKRLAELAMDEICENRVIFIDVGGRILEDCSKDEFFGHPENRQPRTKDFLNKILQH